MRQVWYVQQKGIHLFLQGGQVGFIALQFIAQTRHLGHYRGYVVAFGLQLANLLGHAVSLRLQFFSAGLQLFAFAFQRIELLNVQAVTPLGQSFCHIGQVFAKQLNV